MTDSKLCILDKWLSSLESGTYDLDVEFKDGTVISNKLHIIVKGNEIIKDNEPFLYKADITYSSGDIELGVSWGTGEEEATTVENIVCNNIKIDSAGIVTTYGAIAVSRSALTVTGQSLISTAFYRDGDALIIKEDAISLIGMESGKTYKLGCTFDNKSHTQCLDRVSIRMKKGTDSGSGNTGETTEGSGTGDTTNPGGSNTGAGDTTNPGGSNTGAGDTGNTGDTGDSGSTGGSGSGSTGGTTGGSTGGSGSTGSSGSTGNGGSTGNRPSGGTGGSDSGSGSGSTGSTGSSGGSSWTGGSSTGSGSGTGSGSIPSGNGSSSGSNGSTGNGTGGTSSGAGSTGNGTASGSGSGSGSDTGSTGTGSGTAGGSGSGSSSSDTDTGSIDSDTGISTGSGDSTDASAESLSIPNAVFVKSLPAGSKYQIRLINRNKAKKYKYTSSNKKVAAVNSKGLVTLKSKGTAKIFVKAYNKKGQLYRYTIKIKSTAGSPVKDTNRNLKNLKCSSKFPIARFMCTVKKGSTYQMRVISDTKIKYRVGNKHVCKVSSTGKVKALKKGKTHVTAVIRQNGRVYKYKALITVK